MGITNSLRLGTSLVLIEIQDPLAVPLKENVAGQI